MIMAEIIPDTNWSFPSFVVKNIAAFDGSQLQKANNEFVISTYRGMEVMADCQTYKDKLNRLYVPLFHLKTQIREEYDNATGNI